jgi:hypothetical protein
MARETSFVAKADLALDTARQKQTHTKEQIEPQVDRGKRPLYKAY